MNKSVKKMLEFFDFYEENVINQKLREFLLKNGKAILPGRKVEGISLSSEKVSEEDYKGIVELQHQLKEINHIRSHMKGKKQCFFVDFDLLSKYIKLTSLNAKDILEIIVSIIKQNLEDVAKFRTEFGDSYKNDYPIYVFNKIDWMTNKDCEDMNKHTEESIFKLTKEQLELEMLRLKEFCVPNPEEYMIKTDRFEEIYLDKKESFDESDIDEILNILRFFSVDESIISKIKIFLTKDLEKRDKEKQNNIPIKKQPQLQKKSNVLTDKEYKAIKKELATYFDFYNVEKIRNLNSNEIIHCIELLTKIDTPIEEIQRFISFVTKDKDVVEENLSLLKNDNIIAIYVEIYNKLKFYERKLDIEANLDYISECLQEMFICNEKDYEFYKGEIEFELRKIIISLPLSYEYEIKEAEKRINFKK